MPQFSGYFKIIDPIPKTEEMRDNQELGSAAYSNRSFFANLVQGSTSREMRYREFDSMASNVEISRALDMIAEEMTTNNDKTDMPLDIDLDAEEDRNIDETVVITIRAALKYWCKLHDWENKLFRVARNTIKYGDYFFKKNDQKKKWEPFHPKNVVGIIIDKNDVTKVNGYVIRTGSKKVNQTYAPSIFSRGEDNEMELERVDSDKIVRFTLNDDMSDSAPFGESILKDVFTAFRQKTLIEESIIIYRINRASEKRVFYVDIGSAPLHKAEKFINDFKNEVKQKKIPTMDRYGNQVDSIYNPVSTNEDYFLPVKDGRSSRIETLPAGAGLGELSDLEYFKDIVLMGLRIPSSYMSRKGDRAIFNDGQNGSLYIEEMRFIKFIERLQGSIERVLDEEFKKFLKVANIYIDNSIFRIRLPSPTNFSDLRQNEIQGKLLQTLSNVQNVPFLSARFKLQRFLQLSDEELIINEELLREERGFKKNDKMLIPKLYNEGFGESSGEGGFGGGDLGLDLEETPPEKTSPGGSEEELPQT